MIHSAFVFVLVLLQEDGADTHGTRIRSHHQFFGGVVVLQKEKTQHHLFKLLHDLVLLTTPRSRIFLLSQPLDGMLQLVQMRNQLPFQAGQGAIHSLLENGMRSLDPEG